MKCEGLEGRYIEDHCGRCGFSDIIEAVFRFCPKCGYEFDGWNDRSGGLNIKPLKEEERDFACEAIDEVDEMAKAQGIGKC